MVREPFNFLPIFAVHACQQNAFAVTVRTVVTVATTQTSVVVLVTWQGRIYAFTVSPAWYLCESGVTRCRSPFHRWVCRLFGRFRLRTTTDASRPLRQYADLEAVSLSCAFGFRLIFIAFT